MGIFKMLDEMHVPITFDPNNYNYSLFNISELNCFLTQVKHFKEKCFIEYNYEENGEFEINFITNLITRASLWENHLNGIIDSRLSGNVPI